jgi:hypothetical protein
LINKIDIDIDSCLENYNGEQLLRELIISTESSRSIFHYSDLNVTFYNTFDSPKNKYLDLDSWPTTTKVVDYLKQIRMTIIEKLRKAQEEALEYYKLNSSRFKSELSDEKNIDELRSELFPEKFYFQADFTQPKKNYGLLMSSHSSLIFTCLNLISIHYSNLFKTIIFKLTI